MGFKDYVKKKSKEYSKTREERKKFHSSLAKEELALRREAYYKEAKRQATLRGTAIAREKANKPSAMQRFTAYAQSTQQAQAQPRMITRKRVVKRVVKRVAVPRRKVRIKRKKRRRVTRRVARTTTRVNPISATQNWNF